MSDAPTDSPTVYCRRCRRTIPRSSSVAAMTPASKKFSRQVCGGALTRSCLELAAEHAKQAGNEPPGIRPLGVPK